ncbi:MAG: UMP kinase [Pseudomonadota bacterium]|nr:UMP kinase [Pseudomonadota bacterium]
MNNSTYNRILIKLSGESLFNFDGHANVGSHLIHIVQQIRDAVQMGSQVAIVLGGGNICRGRNMVKSGAKRVTADNVGMLATIINGLIFRDILDKEQIKTKLYSAFQVGSMVSFFEPRQAIDDLERGYVVICCGGTGNPFVSTDTAASLRAIQLEVGAIFKLTNVQGVYNKDPNQHEDAVFLPQCTFDQVIADQLKVMDTEAFRHCQMFNIPIHIASFQESNIILRLINHENIGTKVSSKEE